MGRRTQEWRSETSALHELTEGSVVSGQLYVERAGKVVYNESVGEAVPGSAMRSDQAFNLYCGLKPVVALSLARLLELASIDRRALVSDILSVPHSPFTVGDVCSHAVGLRDPDAFRYFHLSPSERAERLASSVLVARMKRARVVYGEVAGWRLVCLMIEALSGHSVTSIVENDAASVGSKDLWFCADSYDDHRVNNIGCYYDTSVNLPMLHDRLRSFWSPQMPATVGGYSSMESLGRWYSAVLKVRAGEPMFGLPSPTVVADWTTTATQVGVNKDSREPQFGLGLMTRLDTHGFGQAPSPESFGHSGFLGLSFGFADPTNQLAVAFITNELGRRSANPVVNRSKWIDRLYSLIGLS